MSEWWVSRDKYWCKYCSTYIADDKPSRTHHETGLRHKGNYERYIRDIYKKGITEKKDKRDEAREIERIEAAAAAAMGLAPPVPSTSSAPKPKATASTSSSDPYANYSTAAQLGFVDPDVEKAQQEREKRKNEGVVGEWERVVKPRIAKPAVPTGGFAPAGTGAAGVKKEEEGAEVKPFARAEPQEEEQPEQKRRPLFVERSALDDPFLAGNDNDEDDYAATLASSLASKVKKRQLTVKEQAAIDAQAAEAEAAKEAKKKEAEKRGARTGGGWAAADANEDEGYDPLAGLAPPAPAGEEGAEDKPEAKPEEVEEKKPAATGGFKKRKMHGAGLTRKK